MFRIYSSSFVEKTAAPEKQARNSPVNILFIHQNFPAQFKHLAPALAAAGHTVVAFSLQQKKPVIWQGIRVLPYAVQRSSTSGIHPWVVDFETKVIRAEAAFKASSALRAEGFLPDVIVAHPGWGESLFLKEIWPEAKLAIYGEFHYLVSGGDTGFDPEFPVADPAADACRLRLKNLNNLMHFEVADAGLSPTHWQASTFPEPFRSRISVIHDGIDTQLLQPNPAATLTVSTINGPLTLTRATPVITFVNRNLEPYRGYHIFMRALPELLARHPDAQVLIVGGNEVSYGPKPPAGETWKQKYLDEVKDTLDLTRVHFLGHIPYPQFIALLQVSTVHVYLTYPFVLSWSLIEAMSVGCAIVASDTAPLREVIQPGETGLLVPFFDVSQWVERISMLLQDAPQRECLGAAARALAIKQYDLHTVCLPRQLSWLNSLVTSVA